MILALQIKSYEEYDIGRTLSKIYFYFRKKNAFVALSYVNNLYTLCTSLKQKIDLC